MGDLLFSFSGRIGRIGYLLALIFVGVLIAFAVGLSQALGDWTFNTTITTLVGAVAIIVYTAATSKRFQDRSRHPFLGFLFYYIVPAIILLIAQKLPAPYGLDFQAFGPQIENAFQSGNWTPDIFLKCVIILLCILLIIAGQIGLFFCEGTKGENIFDDQPLHEELK